jgi:DNA uptake protein ComE-like DNA-binding protein
MLCDKPDISTATLEQIQSIDGIGEVLSSRIVIYLDTYPNADIDDLTDVLGIGEGKLKLIKRKYGD